LADSFFIYLFMDRLTERSLRFCPLFNLSCAPHFSPPQVLFGRAIVDSLFKLASC
jgi:hypothetical protein